MITADSMTAEGQSMVSMTEVMAALSVDIAVVTADSITVEGQSIVLIL